MEIPRQLGIWRSVLLLVQHRKLLRSRARLEVKFG